MPVYLGPEQKIHLESQMDDKSKGYTRLFFRQVNRSASARTMPAPRRRIFPGTPCPPTKRRNAKTPYLTGFLSIFLWVSFWIPRRVSDPITANGRRKKAGGNRQEATVKTKCQPGRGGASCLTPHASRLFHVSPLTLHFTSSVRISLARYVRWSPSVSAARDWLPSALSSVFRMICRLYA